MGKIAQIISARVNAINGAKRYKFRFTMRGNFCSLERSFKASAKG